MISRTSNSRDQSVVDSVECNLLTHDISTNVTPRSLMFVEHEHNLIATLVNSPVFLFISRFIIIAIRPVNSIEERSRGERKLQKRRSHNQC